jgi:hypothetical protein
MWEFNLRHQAGYLEDVVYLSHDYARRHSGNNDDWAPDLPIVKQENAFYSPEQSEEETIHMDIS